MKALSHRSLIVVALLACVLVIAAAYLGGLFGSGNVNPPQTGSVNASLTMTSLTVSNGLAQDIQVTSLSVKAFHSVSGSVLAEVHASLPLNVPAGGNASVTIEYVTLRPINEIEAQYGDLPQIIVEGTVNCTTAAGSKSLPVQLTITMGDLVTMITGRP